MDNGKQWPIGIIASIIFIVIACAVTVYVALLQPVQQNEDMMLDYQTMDANVNDLVVASIVFNKKYSLSYVGNGVSESGSTIAYKLTDKEGNPINDAKFKVILSRPVVNDAKMDLDKPQVKDGVYSFENIKVTKKGRWNILAKVSVGDDFRHMNLKSDTMDKSVYEFGLDKPMRNYAANGGRTL